jgi:protein phosphatase
MCKKLFTVKNLAGGVFHPTLLSISWLFGKKASGNFAMKIEYPHCALLLLCSPSRKVQADFAARHFKSTEVVASDACRAQIFDDSHLRHASEDAYDLLFLTAELRLKHRRFTVIDASVLKPTARRKMLALAQKMRVPAYILLLDASWEECLAHDQGDLGEKIIRKHLAQFEQTVHEIYRETGEGGFTGWDLVPAESRSAVQITRRDSSLAATHFDVIGDIHGCLSELSELLELLGYVADKNGLPYHPEGRILVSVGDLADRGPDSVEVLRLFIALLAAGRALMVPGNHDDKLFSYLRGEHVTHNHGFETTLEELNALAVSESDRLKTEIRRFLEGQPSHLILDGGKLVIAHAGIKEEMIGGQSESVRRFTLYGEVIGKAANGLPLRADWAQAYRGEAFIVYGHTPQEEIQIVHRTVNIDGGCVFGGFLVALRWPEKEIVTVKARKTYSER